MFKCLTDSYSCLHHRKVSVGSNGFLKMLFSGNDVFNGSQAKKNSHPVLSKQTAHIFPLVEIEANSEKYSNQVSV